MQINLNAMIRWRATTRGASIWNTAPGTTLVLVGQEVQCPLWVFISAFGASMPGYPSMLYEPSTEGNEIELLPPPGLGRREDD